MYYLNRFKKKFVNFLFDHPGIKVSLEYLKCFLFTSLSAFVFSFGFNTFINPNFTAIANLGIDISAIKFRQLATCGASGFAQSLLIILKIIGIDYLSSVSGSNTIYWVLYLLINVPLLIFAFFKIGKRFAIFTLINVVMTSCFGLVLKSNDPYFFINRLSSFFVTQPLFRIVLAGLCTGLSSGFAYIIESSAGGTDVIGYYISEKKSKLIGKYNILINLFVIILFCGLSCVKLDAKYNQVEPDVIVEVCILICTFIYMYVTGFVIDKINTSNTKVLVQIITSKENLSNTIIAAIPHSCTIQKGIGGYSQQEKNVLYVSVRKKELKIVKQVCLKEDKNAFVNVIPLVGVYGKFFREQIK